MRFSDLGNGRFQNPILFADYSDPDVIRVDDIYYMTASSFNYTPGLPILISKDLVNWKLVNYALKNIKEERYDIPRHSEGVWAPAIRFHDGMYYIYYGMPDEGYYVVRTSDPLGEWDEPVCILEGKGLIDPCPFWDDDGKAYIIHGYAKSRIGFKSILGIFEMSSDGLKAVTEDHFIFNGNDPKHPAVTIEGPKVYKREGYYYILAPAGGVKDGYQVALRSQNIHGPYEIKTVMHTGSSCINGPHQGGLVDTTTGEEWFIHFQDRGLYGRICHLQPVSWNEGWPVIGVNPDYDGCGEPVFEMKKPSTAFENEEQVYLEASDEFMNGDYGLIWQWLGNHKDSFTDFCDKGIRLNALNPSKEDEPVIWRSANVLTQKPVFPIFETEIKMNISGLKEGERAGVCMTGGQYVTAYIERNEDGSFTINVAESEGGDKDKKEVVTFSQNLSLFLSEQSGHKDYVVDSQNDIVFKMIFDLDEKANSKKLYFQNVHEPLTGKNPSLKIYVKAGEGEYKDLNIRFTPSDHTWVGAKIGIYALSVHKEADNPGYALFYYVRTKEL
ncbi:MAG: family 43 glycosylhydrolase [Butyrivibrio sp.]|nr:family 43 glycosylhydrolase [Butyrivibrio sp.]